MKLLFALLVALLASTQIAFTQPKKAAALTDITPGQIWPDNNGIHINAHGGGILFFNGLYYWHGEYNIIGKAEKDTSDGGVACYTSSDLINWNNAGLVLSVDYNNLNSDIAYGCIFERPKVVFNEKTRKFVAFFKLFPRGEGYTTAYVGVAVANSPLGPFTYSHKFLGCHSVNGSGDFAMFKDEDGSLYHLTVQKPVRDIYIAKMSDDYLLPEGDYTTLKDIQVSTEAPAMIKRNGVYHLFGSASAGWAPTAPRYYTATNLMGPWTKQLNPLAGFNPLENLGAEKTFGGQSTFIFPIQDKVDSFVMMMDVWKPEKASDGRYIWLPIKFTGDLLQIKWMDKWRP
jgi:hypothetical protein